MTPIKRIAVLISGSGSNLQALIDYCQTRDDAVIACVISNKPYCYGLTRAKQAGITTHTIDHTSYPNREAFDQALASALCNQQVDLILLAGFMRLLTASFVERFAGKLLNIHPSLLPKYPGLNTHQRAIDANDSHAGATVHVVTAELDGGPPIAHIRVPVLPNDTADTLAKRVLTQEHTLYPTVLGWVLDGKVTIADNTAYYQGAAIDAGGLALNALQ